MAKLMNYSTLTFMLNFEVSKDKVLEVAKLPTYFKENDPSLLFVETDEVEKIIGNEKMRDLQVQLTTYIISDNELECINLQLEKRF
jgi:hypothetical protein